MSRLAEQAAAVALELPDLSMEAVRALVLAEPAPNALVFQHRLGLSGRDASTLATYLGGSTEGREPMAALTMLEGAAAAAREFKAKATSVELVWTGPALPHVPARQTEPALRDLVSLARTQVLIVGYSFSEGARDLISQLARLAARGIAVWVIAEEPRQLAPFRGIVGGRMRISTLVNDGASTGIHAKLTIVDREYLLITSANFTSRGFRSNIELGALIRGRAAADASDLIEHLAGLGFVRDVPL